MRILPAVFLGLVATSSHAEGWTADSTTGCKVWNRVPQPNQTVSWSGNCVGGTANGSGIVRWYKDRKPDETYEGSLKDGKMDGKGTFTFTYPEVGKYVGEWKNGIRDGRGTLTEANGDTYSGGFSHDEKHGEGTFTFKSGGSYKGLWQNG